MHTLRAAAGSHHASRSAVPSSLRPLSSIFQHRNLLKCPSSLSPSPSLSSRAQGMPLSSSPLNLTSRARGALLPYVCASESSSGPSSIGNNEPPSIDSPTCLGVTQGMGPVNKAPGTPTDTTSLPLPAYGKLFVTASLPILWSLSVVFKWLSGTMDAIRHGVAKLFPQLEGVPSQDVRSSLKYWAGNLRVMALIILPFARAASSESLTAVYARTFERAAFGFAKMYLFCLFMRVLLSWFPEIDWNAQPWTFLRLIYRGLLPPLFGQLDFTPLFGFLILQDVVEVMAPTYTMGLHDHDTSTRWTTSDVMCYLDGF